MDNQKIRKLRVLTGKSNDNLVEKCDKYLTMEILFLPENMKKISGINKTGLKIQSLKISYVYLKRKVNIHKFHFKGKINA